MLSSERKIFSEVFFSYGAFVCALLSLYVISCLTIVVVFVVVVFVVLFVVLVVVIVVLVGVVVNIVSK